LIDQDNVKRNCFNNITIFSGLQESTYQCLAGFFSGLFTLWKFKDRLEFHGLKVFGPKKYYKLTTNFKDLRVDFYLNEIEFAIERVVFQGFDHKTGKYEVNYDFGPLKEINGLKIPSYWFSSQIGTRGNMYEISKVKINQFIDEDFFSNWEKECMARTNVKK
ncbi:unnamed protein product, partial [marine sediment metagenome]